MTVIVNGKSMELPDELTIDGLLTHLGVRREYTAVAINREVTPKSSYGVTTLRDGDRIEIVRPMGGG
jgi:sulfur carrier protein